jgi:hypothetical protein
MQTAQSPEETYEQQQREFTPERRRALIDAIIGTEGGYVNSSADPGGPTNRGITEDIINEFNAGRPADQQFTTPIDQITRDKGGGLYDWFISKYSTRSTIRHSGSGDRHGNQHGYRPRGAAAR